MSGDTPVETCLMIIVDSDHNERVTRCTTMDAAVQLAEFHAGSPLTWLNTVKDDGKALLRAEHNGFVYLREFID